jgi:hypothetical protein
MAPDCLAGVRGFELAHPDRTGSLREFPEFGNMAGVRPRPFAAIPAWQMEMLPNSVSLNPNGNYGAGRRYAAPSLRRPNSNAGADLMP